MNARELTLTETNQVKNLLLYRFVASEHYVLRTKSNAAVSSAVCESGQRLIIVVLGLWLGF